MASSPVSTYPLATGELAAARLALIESVCGTSGCEVMRSLGVLPGMRFDFCDRVRYPRSSNAALARLKLQQWPNGSGIR